ncbi:MAG: histidine phosphatase family protein [Rudaea sp.]
MATRIVYLVRHGQQATPQIYNGLGNHLSDLGRRQAELTADLLASVLISQIYHSTMRRAAETAHAIARRHPRVPVHASRLLWEGVPYLPTLLAPYFEDVTEEVISRDRVRLDRAFDRFFRPASKETVDLLVCHGNMIRYLVCRAIHAPPDALAHMEINNCGVTQIVVEPEFVPERRTVLYGLNAIGHIPPDLRSFI